MRRISQWLAGVSTLALVGAIGLITSHPAAAAATKAPPSVSVEHGVVPPDLVADAKDKAQAVQFDVATKSDQMVSGSPAATDRSDFDTGSVAKTQSGGLTKSDPSVAMNPFLAGAVAHLTGGTPTTAHGGQQTSDTGVFASTIFKAQALRA